MRSPLIPVLLQVDLKQWVVPHGLLDHLHGCIGGPNATLGDVVGAHASLRRQIGYGLTS
jgi:hypothetical protein